MAGTPGVSAKVFNALGAAAVNVRAIAQGASERNISVVVDGRQATRALRATHASFYLSPNTLSIGVIGPGTVGRVLLDQLASQQARLSREFKLDLRVRGIMSTQAHAAVGARRGPRAVAASEYEAAAPRARHRDASSSTCRSTTCRTR